MSDLQDASEVEADLTDHEYDGIREYDNPMPPWWVWIFWATAYFAGAYFLWFHVLPKGVPVQRAYEEDMSAYREEMAAREMGSSVTEKSLETLMSNTAVMADAETIFRSRCVQCHGAQGEGLIGPNLTDAHWIHGKGGLLDIYGVVNQGVSTKGMPAWGRQLKPIELGKVAAYVGKLRNTNVSGRPPEGAPVSPAPETGGGG